MSGAPVTLDRSYAEDRDRADELARFRDAFAFPTTAGGEPVVYLCGNSLGLMPKAVPEIVEQELEDWAALAVDGHLRARHPWYSYHEQFREQGARLVGANPGEVVMMNTLTVNLHLMMASFYRPSGRRTKVLMEDRTFPSDRYAVATHVAWHGLEPDDTLLFATPREGETTLRTEDLEALIRDRGAEIALVLLGGVNYFTGQAFDLGRVTESARAAGCVVGLDLAHAAGNIPLELHDWNVDFAAWCSYKYLNGGPGAVAGCFVHERHGNDPSRRRLAGWWGNDPATRFQMHVNTTFVPRAGADGWQVSNPPILSLAPLRASLASFDEAGMAALRRKSVALTGYLEALLAALGDDRITIITPRDPAARGCQLSVRVRDDARRLFRRIAEEGVVVDLREPDVIRAAPVPLYNSFCDVWAFADVMRRALGQPASSSPA